MEKPYAVVMRFLGAYSHALALHMRNTRIPARFITYTYDKAYARVKEMSLHKYDGYFHLDMQPEAILCVFRKVMMGYTMLEYNEYEL